MPNGPIIAPAMTLIVPSVQQNAAANNSNSDLVLNDKGKSTADKSSLIGKNSKSKTHLFLLTFEIYFNRIVWSILERLLT